jgi:hypothetical protein
MEAILSFILIIGIFYMEFVMISFFVSGQIYTNSKAGEKYKMHSGFNYFGNLWCRMLVGFAVAVG